MPSIVPEIVAMGTLDDKKDDTTSYFVMQKLDVDMNTYLD